MAPRNGNISPRRWNKNHANLAKSSNGISNGFFFSFSSFFFCLAFFSYLFIFFEKLFLLRRFPSKLPGTPPPPPSISQLCRRIGARRTNCFLFHFLSLFHIFLFFFAFFINRKGKIILSLFMPPINAPPPGFFFRRIVLQVVTPVSLFNASLLLALN